MRLLSLLLAVPLVACDAPSSDTGFVSPFDGQTDWPPAAPLQVRLAAPLAPAGQPLPPDLIRVVDLDVGGRVTGQVASDGVDVWFFPDAAFEPGHRFAWSVAKPHDQAREPHLSIPVALQGSGEFSTAPSVEPVAVSLAGADLCVVLSRSPTDDFVGLAFAGRSLSLRPASPAVASDVEPDVEGGASTRCAPAPEGLPDPADVRVQVGSMVWQLPVERASVDAVLGGRHRRTSFKNQGGSR